MAIGKGTAASDKFGAENNPTLNVTVPSSSDRILIVFAYCATGSGEPTFSATYNGDALTNIDSLVMSGTSHVVFLAKLLNPDTGTNSLAVTIGGAAAVYSGIFAQAFYNVDVGGTPHGTAAKQYVGGTTNALDIASAVGDLVVGGAAGHLLAGGSRTVTADAGQTSEAEQENIGTTVSAADMSTKAGEATDTTLTWVFDSSMDTGAIGVALKEVAAAGPTITDITPDNADADDTTPIVITGSGFSVEFMGGDAVLDCSDAEVSFTSVVVNSDTEIEADLVATSSATPGACTITVETDNGESAGFPFTINSAAAAPIVTSITPDEYTRNPSLTGTVNIECALVGTGLDGASPTFNLPAGWSFTGFSAAGGGLSADVTLIIPIDETAAAYDDLTFETDDGVSNTFTFTVVEPSAGGAGGGIFASHIFGE